MAKTAELPIILFAGPREWEAWVSKHLDSVGLWMKIAKASTGKKSLTYQEALEVALCYGWIDGQKKSLDDEHWLQRFSPRGPRSIWSKINRDKAETLINAVRMKPPGAAAIENAKRNGQWDRAYDSWKSAETPVDLLRALRGKAKAKAFFDSLDSRNRYAILFRIHGARKPETRAARIAKFVGMLERREKIHP